MPSSRRKISAVLHDFQAELGRLSRFDPENQKRFTSQHLSRVSKNQLYFLTESIFFRAFRAYECFIRDLFLLYCLEKRPSSGSKVISHLRPRNFLHAEQLIQSSMRFVDWAKPDVVIERAEVYLNNGSPIKLPITTHREELLDLKRLRNHIAHDSQSSRNGYLIVIRKHYGVIPLSIPSPGEFLLAIDKKKQNKYKLLVYFDCLNEISLDLT